MRVRGTDENTVINEDSSSWFIHCNQCGFEALMKILSSMRIQDSSSWFIHCHQCGCEVTDENTVINWGFEFLIYTLSPMRVRGPDENTVINEDSRRIRVLYLYIVINAGSRHWWKYCHQWGFEFLIYTLSSMRVRGHWWKYCHQWGFEWFILDLYIVINECGFEVLMKILSSMMIRVLDLYIVINASSDENNVINEDTSSWFIHCHQCGLEALMKILSSMRIRDLYIVINAGSRHWWKYCTSMRIRVLDLYIVINAGSRHWWKYCHQWGFKFLIYTLSSMRLRGHWWKYCH